MKKNIIHTNDIIELKIILRDKTFFFQTDEARAINKLKFIAKALLKKDLLLSPARIDELKSMIQSREKCEEVTDELLHNIMSRR